MSDNAETTGPKPLFWIAGSRKDLRSFPPEVREAIGFALWQAQIGRKHASAKPLKGFRGTGVLEIVEDHDGNTYRGVYTVRLSGAVYTLHAFQKKSKKGIKTAPHDIAIIRSRLKMAEEHHQLWQLEQAKAEDET